jgi:ubiquitin C-terminal hydrolase
MSLSLKKLFPKIRIKIKLPIIKLSKYSYVHWKFREPRVVGLDNPSNYCFMNAVIQVLISIKELREYFVNKEYNSITFTTLYQKKIFCLGLSKIFKEMLNLEEDFENLKPTFFHKIID